MFKNWGKGALYVERELSMVFKKYKSLIWKFQMLQSPAECENEFRSFTDTDISCK